MAAKRRSPTVDLAVYAGARGVMSLFCALPWPFGRAAAGALGDLAWALEPNNRKKRALANLRSVFAQADGAWLRRTVRRSYCRFAQSIVDAANFVRYAAQGEAVGLLEAVGFDALRSLPEDAGVIFVSGHFGHWELLGAALPMLGYPVASVGRPVRNERLEAYVRQMRQSTGQRILPKKGAVLGALRLLRKGECVGFLIDQDAGREGVFVDFLGRPASTSAAPARLSVRLGLPIAFVYAARVPGRRKFRVVLAELVRPRPGEDSAGEVMRITQRLTQRLGQLVRQAPENWPWRQRRWRTKPPKDGPRSPTGRTKHDPLRSRQLQGNR
ncbi:MAG: lysophospholipid acyltransferase family protein [Planctomycetota bacterium]|jgi:KDO2-lipid IV(A) lauroyltransferase